MADLQGPARRVRPRDVRADKRTRFRPGYYPFTEPSVAFDVECLVCGGIGCPACSRTGWMTILGRRHGPPGRAPVRRPRPGALPGLRLRDGRRADLEPAPRRRRPAPTTSRTTCASWSSSDESARSTGCATTSTSSSTPEQLAERLTLLGHGGQGHRALGRRLAHRSSSASC